MSKVPIDAPYIRGEGKAGRLGFKLMAIVAEGAKGRCYLSPSTYQEQLANSAKPSWKPEVEFFQQALGFRIGN
jgi:putative DNA methylase